MEQTLIIILLSVLIFLFLAGIIVAVILFKKHEKERKEETKVDENVITRDVLFEFNKIITDDINKALSEYKDNTTKLVSTLNNQSNDQFHKNSEDFLNKLNNIQGSLNTNLEKIKSDVNQKINDEFDKVNKEVNSNFEKGFKDNVDNLEKVQKALGEVSKSTESLNALQDQVTSLNNVLQNTQKRGRFGEVILEDIIENIYGEAKSLYAFQYDLKKGKKKGNEDEENATGKPDAVIFLPGNPERVLCIDSKFPFLDYEKLMNDYFEGKKQFDEDSLKNFKKTLNDEVNKIAKSYIDDKQTAPYALMFVPNDSIYFFIYNNDEFDSVRKNATSKKVILVSPSLLHPILSNINVLMRNYRMTKELKDIVDKISSLMKNFDLLNTRWEDLSKHINKLVEDRDKLDTTHRKIMDDANKIKSLSEKNAEQLEQLEKEEE